MEPPPGILSQPSPSDDTPASARSRLLVLMFTDLVGSTGLKDKLTTTGYLPLLRRHDALLREAIASTGGRFQQDTGDGCFALFATSSDAAKAALVFQWKMNAEPWPQGHRLSARVGIHLGELAETEFQQDGGPKLVGIALDLAARVMSASAGGQILLTRTAFNDARQFIATHPCSESTPLKWMAHGPYMFKGSAEPVDLFEVGIEGQSPLSPPGDTEKARRVLRPGEEQVLGWRPAVGLAMPNNPLWLVEKKIGEGGFGEVWLARHAKLKSARVFKFCFDSERLRALKREVVLFRLLKESIGDRRDISRVIDWQFDEAPYFIEMDYAPAGNLTDWLAAQGGVEKVPLVRRLQIVAQIARALSAAHSVGILHKDIKPSNVLMVQDAGGEYYPRLTDFGIGILTNRERLKDFNITEAGFTESNLTMNDSSRTGSRMFAPPESLSEKPHTVQGDVYALGVVLFQLVVGDLTRPLGIGWERSVTDELLREDIAACVDVDPARRLASAAALAERLETLDARRRQRQQLARRAEDERLAKRRRVQVRVLVGALALLTGVVLAMGWLWKEAAAQRTEAIKQRNEAAAQRAAADRETAYAKDQEHRVRATLAEVFVVSGWREYEKGDTSFALLHFARALQVDPSAVNRYRLAATLDSIPRVGIPARLAAPSTRPVVPLRTVSIQDNKVDILDAATGKPVIPTLELKEFVRVALISPDGTKVVTASGATGQVWNAITGKPIGAPLVHASRIVDVKFSSNTLMVMTAGLDDTARVWDTTTGKPLTPELRHQGIVACAAFSPDGSKVITGSYDQTANVWDMKTGERTVPPLEHESRVEHVAFSPDGLKVLTATDYGAARVWDPATGRPLTSRLQCGSDVAAVSFSADGSQIDVSDSDGRVRTWEIVAQTPIALALNTNGTLSASLSPDGSRIVMAGADGTARVFDMATGKVSTPPMKHGAAVRLVKYSWDGSRILTVSDKTAQIWAATTGKPLGAPMVHQAWIKSVEFSSDNTKVATASDDNTARVWNASTGNPLTPPLQHETRVLHIAFSPDGSKVVTNGEDTTAHVWDAATGKQFMPLSHKEGVHFATFSPDGSRIVTASFDETAQVWDAVTGKPVTPPLQHLLGVNEANFNFDGSKLVTASDDRTARVWDAATGKPLTPPLEHPYSVEHASFSSDGSKVLTVTEGAIRVWDVATGHPLTPPLQHLAEPQSYIFAAFSNGGSRLVTAASDGVVRLWPLGGSDLSDADFNELAEVVSSHRLDETGTLVPLTDEQWHQRYTELSTRHPERFLPVASAPATTQQRVP